MRLLSHIPYIAWPFTEAKIIVRREMSEKFKAEGSEIYQKVS